MSVPASSGRPTDPSLLREIRDLRNGQQWTRFVEDYTPYLTGMLRRRGFSQNDISDLVQETFLAVANHIGDFQYDPSRRFRGWLATIALRNAWRHQQRSERKGRPRGGTTNLLHVRDQELREDWTGKEERNFGKLLARLRTEVTDLEWDVFRLSVLGKMPVDETAAALNITKGYLYVCRSRANRTVKQLAKEVIDE